jgi:hypothetical protein
VNWREFFWYAVLAGAGTVVTVWTVHVVWHLRGRWKIRRAGPRRLIAIRHRIWREPAIADATDLRFGPGGAAGAPVPPYRFIEEHLTGSQPCVAVRDARNRLWRVKWGHEARPEAFAVRVAHACGYFAEVTHYVASGRITEVKELTRARPCISEDGEFADARFELEDGVVRTLFDEHSWSWNDNPFVGTRKLSGLKLVTMLLSNWDTKDRRDVARGSNTAIFEVPGRWGLEARYLITDWGGAMGRWGSNIVSRGRWDPAGFEAQTPHFVTGVRDGFVNFGYQGQRTSEIARDITVEHAAWFFRYARRLNEPALRQGLLACGATPDEADVFARSLVERIRQVGEACGHGSWPGNNADEDGRAETDGSQRRRTAEGSLAEAEADDSQPRRRTG